VTVPLVAALGIGLASSIPGRNPVIDGFGLIAFASLTPMIFVQIYGIYVYQFVDAVPLVHIPIEAALATPTVSEATSLTLGTILESILNVTKDVVPILAVIVFFQYVILKQPLPASQLKQITLGFILVILGLDAFIIGLEMGLFSLGESMAFQLTALNNPEIIYAFGFAIGFATTMAEPALMAIAKKSKEISHGKINDFMLRIFVAFGVAIGIALGSYRIVQGDFIQYYIIGGYILVVILTHFSPRYIIPIAYDSGGVTTSTVTVPLVAALGIGLATTIPGRSPLMDGFGLIAFASLFPMITVMAYGVISEAFHFKTDEEIATAHPLKDTGLLADELHLSTANLNTANFLQHMPFAFSAIVTIVPKEKKDDALHAAREAGATGVTMFNGHGMGLHEMDNMYRHTLEATDSVLMFIVPSQIAKGIIETISTKLHLTTTGDGIVFSTPITDIHGISLRQQQIFMDEVS
jgi:nitrogen regulatory protein PII